MLSIASNLRIYLCVQPTDMRKSFDGLSAIVRSEFKADPTDGSLFLFCNRRRDRIKILYWDRDGLALWYKRLEQGTFEMLAAEDGTASIEISEAQLSMLLKGISIATASWRKRFALPDSKAGAAASASS